jgi:regulator of sirC expression with transglutaminase-like and TPR domain
MDSLVELEGFFRLLSVTKVMSSAAVFNTTRLSKSQQAALINLLSDEDAVIYKTVRDKILSVGPDAVKWLRPHTLSSEPLLRRRAGEIIQHFARQVADNDFLGFCLKHGEEFDIEEGSWLLAKTHYPEINVEAYQALLDSFASSLKTRIEDDATPKEMLSTINNFIFDELEFHGNEENYYDPENSYLNRVIDRRMGNPINICLVYILLARRLRLPVTGIGLPGHFICRYQSSAAEIYIDAFNAGRFLTKADCVQFLLHGNYSLHDDYLTPVTARRFLMRVCGNLHQIYQQLSLPEDTTRLQRYLIALAR